MPMEYAEDCSVFRCTKCGHLEVIGMDEQPNEECERCEEIKSVKECLDNLYYLSNYCGFRNNNCESNCLFWVNNECGFLIIPEDWKFLEKIKEL